MRAFLLFVMLLVAGHVAAAQLSAGPMLGHVTSRTAQIWVQAEGAAVVDVEYWPAARPQDKRRSASVLLDPADDFTAHLSLVGLEPGTRYVYQVYLDGTPTGATHGLRTLPSPRAGHAPELSIYLGSCAYVNDPAVDRPGTPYGGSEFLFETLARQAADNPRYSLMLWLGDNVYLREADYASPWGMNARYRHARSTRELQPLLAALPHYAIWDDHDYGPNDANRSFVFKEEALRLFRRYWANPSYGLAALPGIFTTFSVGDADFFLLDDRFYRAADKTEITKEELDLMKEAREWILSQNALLRLLGRRYFGSTGSVESNKVLFGAEQLDWLKQALIQSRATFKFIAAGSQLMNENHPFEGWHNFPQERDAFLAWLKRQNIPGVVFLSGDRHHTELLRRTSRDFYPLYELTCSPLTAGTHTPQDKEADNPLRVKGTLVSARNFCRIDLVGSGEDRRLVLQSYDAHGKLLWEHTIAKGELRWPPPEQ